MLCPVRGNLGLARGTVPVTQPEQSKHPMPSKRSKPYTLSVLAYASARAAQRWKRQRKSRLGYTVSDGPTPAPRTARHMLTMFDVTKDEVMDILRVATAMKESRRHFMNTGFDRFSEILKGCSLLTLFEKPSLRTRVSLECGMNQLGGWRLKEDRETPGFAIFYSIADSPLGAKESIEDCEVRNRLHGWL
ncbi:unnamed protein product [Effrenium voratum]|nr:unnamed protein product [Effrenium voratum]